MKFYSELFSDESGTFFGSRQLDLSEFIAAEELMPGDAQAHGNVFPGQIGEQALIATVNLVGDLPTLRKLRVGVTRGQMQDDSLCCVGKLLDFKGVGSGK